MILTRSFNFIHIMKSGGTWMLRALEQMPNNFVVQNRIHAPYRDLGPKRAAMPTYAIMRNPWDWHVSMYTYLQDVMKNTRQDFAKPFKDLDAGRQELYKLYTGSFEDVLRSELLCRRELGKQYHDYCDREDGLHKDIRWLRFEDGMLPCLDTILSETQSGQIPKQKLQRFKNKGKINAIRRPHYSTFYTPELRDIVAKLESEVIETFSYKFEKP